MLAQVDRSQEARSNYPMSEMNVETEENGKRGKIRQRGEISREKLQKSNDDES